MKIEDFKKIKEELIKAKKQNDYQINLCDERTRMSSANNLEYKVILTLTFSTLGYAVLFLASSVLINAIGITAFTNVIPALEYPTIMLATSLGIGTITRKLFDKKFKIKERLEKFSNAKTQAEKLEEEVHYQIELEKATNRNKVIDKSIDILNSNASALRRISNRFNIIDKNSQTNKEPEQKVEKSQELLLKEEQDKLDTLTTKKVLNNKFWRIRSRYQKFMDTTIIIALTAVLSGFFCGFPLFLVQEAITYSSVCAKLVALYTPFVIGGVGASVYMAKRNKDYKKVFNKFNSKLGSDALKETEDNIFEEERQISSLIENKINDTSLALVNLKEEQVLETISRENVKDENNSMQNQIPLFTEEEVKSYIEASPAPLNTESIFESTDKQKQGPTLVKKK